MTAAAPDPASPPASIVAIDDDALSLKILERALREKGYAVRSFSDPEAGVAHVLASRPDLVLTDYMMPGLTGLDVIERIRAAHPPERLPIVLLTGTGEEPVILQCFSAGASDYLAKPFNPFELKAKVGLLLARAAAAARAASTARAGQTDPSAPRLPSFAGYTLVRKIGEGGMGVVYEALGPEGKRVALKVLAPALASDRELLLRFFREAAAMKAVRHPGIAAFHDIGQQDLQYYLVMELVEGDDLERWLPSRAPLPEATAVEMVLQLARAIGALHEKGIVHRDLKPSNVLVTKTGALKLIDFGLAKQAKDTALTAANLLMGTAGYIAPELIAGRGAADVRCDLYALGVIFYELVTGKRPFAADSHFATLSLQATSAAPDPRTRNALLGAGAAAVVMRLLEREPDKRYATPAEVVAALEPLLGALGTGKPASA